MTDSIVVATDLSSRGDRAVARAVRLAAEQGAQLTALNVTDDALPQDMAEKLQADAEQLIRRFIENLPDGKSLDVTINALIGDPTVAILEATESADLLVLGTHRPRPFVDLFRETTMERIVRMQSKPVLLVHDAADHDYRNVLCALDFAPASTNAMTLAGKLAPKATLHGMHAVHIPYKGLLASSDTAGTAAPFMKDAAERLRVWRDMRPLPEALGEVEIVEGSASGLLHSRAETLAADLITIGAHGRPGTVPWTLGSMASELIRNPKRDLLMSR